MENISTEEHALSKVNVDTVESVGTVILKFMDGLTPVGYTFKWRNQAVTLGMTYDLCKNQ